MPYLGATRHSFLKYCINNSLLPLAVLVYYSIASAQHLHAQEHLHTGRIIALQFGFYTGFIFLILISFFYFFRVGRDLLKSVLATINPHHIREIIPYDSLDSEHGYINARTFINENLHPEKITDLDQYPPRLLNLVLRRHHRNATAATIFAIIVLVLLGVFINIPALRIPAAAGFLLLFGVLMGVAGAVKYFLKSWEIIGWLVFVGLLAWLVKLNIFDMRSIAIGINYKTEKAAQPKLDYDYLKATFTPEKYRQDSLLGIQTLNNWKTLRQTDTADQPPAIILSVSGGGLRSAYYTFCTLQFLDSLSHGELFKSTIMITGASGGMIGASWWRALHTAAQQGKIPTPYGENYRRDVSDDILNAIIFSLASVDMISPVNKFTVRGYSYTKDRGYAMEQELIDNSHGLLDGKVTDYAALENSGQVPAIIYNATIVNDGRKLLMSAQPVSYLTQPRYSLTDSVNAPIDAIDFGTFFAGQQAKNLRTVTALRMNATFPFILPVVRLPSVPVMNVMDAGLRDNFGIETASRYVNVFWPWLAKNTRKVVLLQIRDTRENAIWPPTEQNTLGSMLAEPIFAVENKWQLFQSYTHSYLKEYLNEATGPQLTRLNFQYIPSKSRKNAGLSFHLTSGEKRDIEAAVFRADNLAAGSALLEILSSRVVSRSE